MTSVLLDIKGLCKRYPVYGSLGKLFAPKTHMHAISDISFQLMEGETYGLVGESGCGKSTTGRSIVGLVKPDAGEVLYNGKNLLSLDEQSLRPLRRDLQMVFQDPLSSLNPRQRIGALLAEPLIIQKMGDAQSRRKQVMDTVEKVGLSEEHYFRFPHELSGGQIQRLGIARALIINPKLVICDEAVSALDVSIQAQIVNMLKSLQRDMGLTLLFISHDISVVKYVSHRIGVMYLGSLVEEGFTDELFEQPLHPYTQLLFSAVPDYHKKRRPKHLPVGELPVRTDDFRGCVFHTRCSHASDRCRQETPQVKAVGTTHKVACHLA